MNTDILGYAATSLNLVMLLPQVASTWKTKQTAGLSLASLIIFTVACLLWIAYGVANAAFPVILANTIVGIMNVILIFLKLKYPQKM